MGNILDKIALSETRDMTNRLLKEYYIQDDEYKEHWKSIQKKVFNDNPFPKNVFNKNFQLYALTSASVLSEEEYNILRQCLKLYDNLSQYILIVEDTKEKYPIRLKIPLECEWKDFCPSELNERLSIKVFHFTQGNYYVFSDSGNWGKYVETDNYDIDIYGFLFPEMKIAFQNMYYDTSENKLRVKESLYKTEYFNCVGL